jgi:hypothetical protein
VITTSEPVPDPFSAVDGVSLVAYVEVCRDLIRTAGDSARRTEETLAVHGLSPDRWVRLNEEWAERIRQHPILRAEFRRLYAGPSAPSSGARGNE